MLDSFMNVAMVNLLLVCYEIVDDDWFFRKMCIMFIILNMAALLGQFLAKALEVWL